jgi:hypothetical protein
MSQVGQKLFALDVTSMVELRKSQVRQILITYDVRSFADFDVGHKNGRH